MGLALTTPWQPRQMETTRMISAESSRLVARAIKAIIRYGLPVLTAMLPLVGEYSSAQTTFDSTPFQTHDWRSTESSDAINYRGVSGVRVIIRPTNPNQTVEQALRDHHAEVPSSASLLLSQGIFDSDDFKNKSTESKWKKLRGAVGRPALSLTTDPRGATGQIYIPPPLSIRDVIRHATPEQLGALFELDAVASQDQPIASNKQVAPGTPVGNGDFSSKPCADSWCGSPKPQKIEVHKEGEDAGRAVITYHENAYEQVVVLQPDRIGLNPAKKRCTATLIAPSWALSALHCFGPSGKSIRESFDFAKVKAKNWLELTATDSSVFAISMRREEETLAFLVEKIYVPYVNKLDIKFQSGKVPPKDIALIKIQVARDKEKPLLTYPKFAGAKSIVTNAAVTFVGYGWTDINEYDWRKSKQAAFNWLTNSNEEEIGWQTGNLGGNGGPCRGDSGGPIFLGILRGYSNETARIVGVVSALRGNGVEKAVQCLGRTGVGEPLFPHLTGICAITDDVLSDCKSKALSTPHQTKDW